MTAHRGNVRCSAVGLSPAGSVLAAVILTILALATIRCAQDNHVFELAGSVERTRLELAAPVSETIVELPVALGGRLEAGQIVVQLDAEVAQAELAAAEAALAAAEAAVTESQQEFNRMSELRKKRVASAQDLDRAIRVRNESLAIEAERTARATQARKRLANLMIRTHLPGVVDQLPFEIGERVPQGAVVAVVQADELPWVRIWLPARAVPNITSSARAEVAIEGFERVLKGRLEDVSREPEFTPHYALTERESAHLVFRGRVVLVDAPADLRPGVPAQVTLTLPKRETSGG